MDGIKQTLTAKVGPLPAYAWAVLVLGVYLGYSYFTKTGFFAPKTTTDGTTGGTDGGGAVPSGDNSGGGLGGILPGGVPPIGGPGSTGTTGANITNPVPSYYSPSDGGFTGNPLAVFAPSSSTGSVSYAGAGPPSQGDLPVGSYSIAGPSNTNIAAAPTTFTTPTGIKSTPGKTGGYTL